MNDEPLPIHAMPPPAKADTADALEPSAADPAASADPTEPDSTEPVVPSAPTLALLEEQIGACTGCALHERRTQAVPGTGPDDAALVLVGEAPGKAEDETGLPFIGRAGELLDECLAEAGLDRDGIFITSIIKCRPPRNRNPYVGEVEACIGYLTRQLELIAPAVIGLFGNTAFKSCLGETGIKKHRGEPIEKDGRVYVVTFHPAAVVRNKHLRAMFVEDLALMHDLVSA